MHLAAITRTARVVAILGLTCILPPSSSGGQTNPPLTAAAKNLGTAALPRNPAETKIDSNLLIATRPPNPAAAVGQDIVGTTAKDQQGRIPIDIKANISPDLIHAIESLGGAIIFAPTDPRIHTMRAALAPDKIAILAARSDIVFIRTALEAIHNISTPEGNAAHDAPFARTTYAVTGAGVKVGVISDSADDTKGSLGKAFTSNDMTRSLEILKFQAGSGEGEGLAMLEIVHALAPDAQLYFATDRGGLGAAAQNIEDLEAAGCAIIVDDVSFSTESPFQDGEVSQAVNRVTNKGVLYFSSAANSGNKSSNTSSTYEGDFKPFGPAPATWTRANGQSYALPHAGEVMGFVGANGQLSDRIILAPTGHQSSVTLFWNDPLGDLNKPKQAVPNQYDLYVFDQNDNLIGASVTTMGKWFDPYQYVGLGDTRFAANHRYFKAGDYLKVVKATQAAARFIHLEVPRVPFKDQSIATNGSTHGHNASGAANAFSVGAVAAPRPEASFATVSPKPKIEDFSSDGPRRMFYAPDGTPYSNDLTSSGGLVLQKPDVAAADDVTTTVPAMLDFSGTSAAAPHAAAIAALVLSYRPNLTPAQVKTILIASALDIGTGGWNADSGYGIPMADKALMLAGSMQFAPRIEASANGAIRLNADGTITGWPLPSNLKAVAISSGPYKDLALLSTGAIAYDLWSSRGKLRDANSNVVSVSADGFLVKADGHVEFWPGPRELNPVQMKAPDTSGMTDIVSASGQFFSLDYFLKRNGTVERRSNFNFSNVAMVPVDNVMAAKALYLRLTGVFLRRDGTVVTARDTTITDDITYFLCAYPPCTQKWAYVARPPDVRDITQIAVGWAHVLALKKDGTVIAWGSDQKHQAEVPAGLKDVVSIAGYGYMSYALTRDGRVVSWGGPN